MSRALAVSLLAGLLIAACKPAGQDSSTDPGRAGTGGASGTGGAQATGGSGSGSGGSLGSGGSGGGSGGASGSGGAASGTGGSASGTGGSGSVDAPVVADTPVATDSAADDGPPSAHLPGRPDLKICAKDWTPEQCCAFLCSCLGTICSDSPKGKPGIATCMTWCPKLSNMARRCHVYHCYVSVSPTGGIKDHDSHCGHAADQVAGGGCPAEVYQ